MNKINKPISIGILVLILMLIDISYAQTSETFSDILTKINDFFEKREFEAHTKTIDFFVFSLLFISIYLIGVKYAFKEVNKPEKVIAVVLGLMSAFLMVSQDYSLTKLLPFVKWFLYFLLFVVLWWLLKGMKSKFLRFILALLITLIIAALVEGFFDFEPEEFAESFAIAFIPKNENKK